jgi:undecaprenyl-diphosphatase
LSVFVIGLGAWGLISLTDSVREGHTQNFDNRVIVWFVHHPGPPWLQDVGRDLTALGGVAVLTLFTLAVTGYLLIARKRGAALMVLIAVLGGLMIGSVLKKLVDRDRPPREYQAAYVFTHSFPSGHSMLSAVTYLTLGALLAQVTRGRWLRLYLIGVSLVLTFLVGLSRVYLRVHWPTDVLAGWTAGLIWSILCLLVARALQRRGAVETDGETPQGSNRDDKKCGP